MERKAFLAKCREMADSVDAVLDALEKLEKVDAEFNSMTVQEFRAHVEGVAGLEVVHPAWDVLAATQELCKDQLRGRNRVLRGLGTGKLYKSIYGRMDPDLRVKEA